LDAPGTNCDHLIKIIYGSEGGSEGDEDDGVEDEEEAEVAVATIKKKNVQAKDKSNNPMERIDVDIDS